MTDAAAWAGLAKRYAAIPSGGKEAALITLLKQNPQEKKLVFVHHRDTLDSLAALLRNQRIGESLDAIAKRNSSCSRSMTCAAGSAASSTAWTVPPRKSSSRSTTST